MATIQLFFHSFSLFTLSYYYISMFMIIITPLCYLPNPTIRSAPIVRLLLYYTMYVFISYKHLFPFKIISSASLTYLISLLFLLLFVFVWMAFYLWCIQLKIIDNCDHCKPNWVTFKSERDHLDVCWASKGKVCYYLSLLFFLVNRFWWWSRYIIIIIITLHDFCHIDTFQSNKHDGWL